MNKAYARIAWENYPSDKTPINERNLNKIDYATDIIDDRVVTLDATKLDKTTAATMVKDVAYNESTGVFTITYLNGATIILDTKLEKLAVNFNYDKENQQLVIALDDGTKQYVDLSSLITEYEFSDTDTIAFAVDGAGKVSAIVKNGSITEDKLQSNYLADIKVEVAKAKASAMAALTSETNAEVSETNAKASETAAAISESNAKASETAAAISESNAASSASESATSAENALSSAEIATLKANAAAVSESNAKESEQNASASATSASEYADTAKGKALESSGYADISKSYAVGTDGAVRENDNTDNAKYFYEQVKQISQGINGIIPMGTVAFADLPASGMSYGWMYNISDEFVSDERFNDGGGVYYGAGNNVIWTSDDLWDVTASSSVTGVKGNKETTYRQGNVNITPENIGALPENGNAVSATKATQDENGNNIVATYQTKTGNTNNNAVTFTTDDSTSPTGWTNVEQMKSGEKHNSLFNKISTMFKNVRWLYKMLGTTDISGIGDGTTTGAIAAQNETLAQLNTNLSNLNTVTWIVEGGHYFNTARLLSFKGTNYVVHVLIHASLDGKTYRFYQRFQIGSSLSTELTYYLTLPSFTYNGNQSYYAVVKMDNWVMSLESVVLGNIDKTADATVYIGLSVG